MNTLHVVSATPLEGYKLRIVFSDNVENVVDFSSYLHRFAHPDYAKYLNEATFKQFDIIDGNVNWNDYHMIFTIESLYSGKI